MTAFPHLATGVAKDAKKIKKKIGNLARSQGSSYQSGNSKPEYNQQKLKFLKTKVYHQNSSVE
jgi:hypothetical protein